MSTRLLALAAAATFATTAVAQCSDNTHPIVIVDAAGAVLPTALDTNINETAFLVPTEEVFLAFDASLASGLYYVHVTDTPINGMDEVVSRNDPMDRFVQVDNNNGVISLSLPFSSNPNNAVFGVGENGVGQSLRLNPYTASQYSQCRFKVWYGDVWNLANGENNPYLLQGGINPTTGGCAVRSYHSFVVGDGSGSDVTGCVFADSDRDGVRQGNEAGIEGQTVRLITDSATLTALTDAQGKYRFENVGKNEFTMELEVPNGFIATTGSSNALSVCNCAEVAAPDFGLDVEAFQCDAKPLCYWVSCRGARQAVNAGILQTLPALCIVNTCGYYVAPCTKYQFRCYLWWTNSWNMARSLSGHLVAMQANLLTGRVHPDCVICDPCLGVMTVADLVQQSIASLCANPFTPPCSGSARHHQKKLRNALYRANKNWIWQIGRASCRERV